MKPGTAEFRRANSQPSYKCMPREEWRQRAIELAKRGEALAKKLTENDVRAIRANTKGMTDKEQAMLYGVHPSMIFQIRKRIKWGCVR